MPKPAYQGIRPANPQLVGQSKPRRRFPSPMVDVVILAGVAIAGFIASLLPFFRLTTINVQGQEKLNPPYVVEQVRQYLARQRLGVLPQSSFFYADTTGLRLSLTENLRAVLPISSVTVVKRFPRTIEVKVQEQAPAAVLEAGDDLFFLDAAGTASATKESDDSVPRVVEANGFRITAGEQVVQGTVLEALPVISQALTERSLGPVIFRTPLVECPFDLRRPVPQPLRPAQENANTNTSAENTNQEQGSEAVSAPPGPQRTDCDLRTQLRDSVELVAVTADKWTIHFDVARPVQESLDSLFIALASTLKNQPLRSVDLRFLPRIIYQ